jgi:uncharacterized SAM-binding protein YcdF (DUF218 family)
MADSLLLACRWPRYRLRMAWLARATVVGCLVIGAALAAEPALRLLGSLVVEESPLVPADAIVVSGASGIGDALEAGRLYREGRGTVVLVPGVLREPHLEELRRLGVVYTPEIDVIRSVLERSGVPAQAIRVIRDAVDGTESEVAVTAAFAKATRQRTLLVVTARSHSARMGWLLRRVLPAETAVVMRSPEDDPFDPDGWWHSREQTRELMAECLRWINSALAGDLWRARPQS